MAGRSVVYLGAVLGLLGPAAASAQQRSTREALQAELGAIRQENDLLIQIREERRKHRALLSELGMPAQAAPAPAVAAADPQDARPPAPEPAKAVDAPPKDPKAEEAPKGVQSFGGIEFGIGLAFTYDLGNRDRIKEAELFGPDRIVRATHVENLRARIVLESHYLFTPGGRFLGLGNVRDRDGRWAQREWGLGPFVAIQPGTDNVIEAVGAGVMLGFRRPSDDPKATDSFNVGLGVMYDLNSQVLGDGIRENQPLPAGETEVRYRKQSQSAFLIMTSYSF